MSHGLNHPQACPHCAATRARETASGCTHPRVAWLTECFPLHLPSAWSWCRGMKHRTVSMQTRATNIETYWNIYAWRKHHKASQSITKHHKGSRSHILLRRFNLSRHSIAHKIRLWLWCSLSSSPQLASPFFRYHYDEDVNLLLLWVKSRIHFFVGNGCWHLRPAAKLWKCHGAFRMNHLVRTTKSSCHVFSKQICRIDMNHYFKTTHCRFQLLLQSIIMSLGQILKPWLWPFRSTSHQGLLHGFGWRTSSPLWLHGFNWQLAVAWRAHLDKLTSKTKECRRV